MISDSYLTDQARGIAKNLSYNEPSQAAAKHTLLEMAHRLDARDIRIHRKRFGLLLVNALGKTRFATWREVIAYRVFGVPPPRV